ncbi:TIGR03943 family protein [soil metagenome]
MDERTQGALLLAVGGVSVRLGLTDAALTYIRPEFVPLLVLAGAILLVFGGITLARGLREQGADSDAGEDNTAPGDAELAEDKLISLTHPLMDQVPGHDHGHDHGRGPRVAWMLAAPLFAILLIAPPPLGSFAANRQSGVIQTTASSFPPLPAAEDGAVPLTLGNYSVRALYDTEQSLAGERVRLTGFVTRHVEDGVGTWLLTRFAMSCCAADGTAISVEAVGDEPPPPVDQWVVVEGTWENRDDHEIGSLTADPPLLMIESVQYIDQPVQTYEN